MSGEDYDEWRLADRRGALLSEHDLRFFHEMLPDLRPEDRVLEIGAGTGRFTIPALEAGISLIAADINESLLASLKRKVAELGFADRCEIREENIFDLSFADASFDLVFSFHVIPRFLNSDDQRAALTEVARVIRPGGKFLFNFRGSRSFYSLLYSGHATDPAEVERILADAGMRITVMRGKWLLNRRLINLIGTGPARLVMACDWALRRFMPSLAWDVFLLAEKEAEKDG
jgi:SAM-dependent methyltransferase